MEISPEQKSADDWYYEYLIDLVGKDGIAFLNLDNAITAVKQKQRVWQAPFVIGLLVLPLLYNWKKDNKEIPISALVVAGLVSQIHSQYGETIALDLTGSTLESLELLYKQMSTEVSGDQFTDIDAHMLFHIRFALGVLLLVNEDEERARIIIREMADTKTVLSRPISSTERHLGYIDICKTQEFAAIIIQDYYAMRQDYANALQLLVKAVTSLGPGYYSENLLAIVPVLIESFAEKCEQINDFGDWVDLLDQVASVIKICGNADTFGDRPSSCKETSPQFLAWKFGQIVARYAIRNRVLLSNDRKIVPDGYRDHGTGENSILGFEHGGYGGDWLNGTMVASLLLGSSEHCNWRLLHEQYLNMWEGLPRYQWLPLCEAGTQTDLYWAARVGFTDAFLNPGRAKIEFNPTRFEDTITPKALSDIQDAMNNAYSNPPEVFGLVLKRIESLEHVITSGTHSKIAIKQELQKWLSPVWIKLPASVVNLLVKAENYYRTGVETDNAKIWFNKAVEASLNFCFSEPLAKYTAKHDGKTIAIRFPAPKGLEHKNSAALHKISLWEWGQVFELLTTPADRSLVTLGTEDFRQFMREYFGELSQPALKELSRSLLDFCQQRKDASHDHLPRHEVENQELDRMRELALGTKRASVITQIFHLFTSTR